MKNPHDSNTSTESRATREPKRLQRSRPSGPRVVPLLNVGNSLYCSNVCRSPNRVPDSRCGLLLTQHTVSRPRRWMWGMVGARLYSLDTVCYTWATAREAASSLFGWLVNKSKPDVETKAGFSQNGYFYST